MLQNVVHTVQSYPCTALLLFFLGGEVCTVLCSQRLGGKGSNFSGGGGGLISFFPVVSFGGPFFVEGRRP